MADVRPLKKGSTTQFAEMSDSDTIPASMIGVTPVAEVPSGTVNGSNVTFTLSETPVSGAAVMIALDGGVSTNGTDFTVSGTTITFAVAPATGTEIFAMYNSIGGASSGGGDFSSNTSSSVDGEVVLFSGTGGKTGKRATGSGFAKLTSGVLSAQSAAAATAELDVVVGDSGSGGTKGLVPAPASGDAAALKFLRADSTWATTPSSAPSVISPSQITSDQNDYAPTGWSTATHVRVSSDSGMRAITSFSSSGLSDGHEKVIINVGDYPLYIPGEHPAGTAANRVKSPCDFILLPNEKITITLDATASRWLVPRYTIHTVGRQLYYEQSPGSTTAGDYGAMGIASIVSGTITTGAPTAGMPAFHALSTSTGATSGYYVFFAKSISTFTALSNAHIWAESLISLPTLSDGSQTYTISVQITATTSSASESANNTVGIRYGSAVNSGKFQGYSRDNAGSESTADLGITVAADTLYRLRVEIDKSKTEARFYVNGAMLGRVTGNMPNSVSVGTRTVILKSAGTTARILRIHSTSAGAIYP